MVLRIFGWKTDMDKEIEEKIVFYWNGSPGFFKLGRDVGRLHMPMQGQKGE